MNLTLNLFVSVDGPDVKIPRTHATTPRPNSGSSSTSSRPWEWTTVRPSTTSARPSTQKLTTISQKVPSTNKPTEALPTTTRPIAQPEPDFTCTKAGFSPDFKDLKKFHNCVDMNGVLKDFVFTCPGKSVFDPSQNVCGHRKINLITK